MDFAIGAILTSGAMGVAGIVWGVRQEGRINAHDQKFIDQKELQAQRDLTESARFNAVIGRLDRIEKKQDAQNGFKGA